MFSAIIPTLWKSHRTIQLIADLCASEYVGEVIIINNNYQHTPQLPPSVKIKHIELPVNIYVNAAWNIGALMARYEDLLICNDDISFNPSFLGNFADGSLKHIGIIGMAWENYQLKADNNIHLKAMQARPYGWGCLMLINIDKYDPIPTELLIANGDDWLAQHATPFVLHGLSVQSEISTTSRMEEFGMIQLNDNKNYNEKYAK